MFAVAKEYGATFGDILDGWTCEMYNAACMILQEDRQREARIVREMDEEAKRNQDRRYSGANDNVRPMTMTDFMSMQPKKPKNMKG